MIRFETLLGELTERVIPFVVVGAMALGPNAAPRFTQDLDILIPAEESALDALERLFREWGATRADGSPLPASLFDGEHGINAPGPGWD